MEENIYLTNLYDYYKELLTEKQKEYFERYFFDNLTMDEIAEELNVSKNAISKSIIEIKEKLLDFEKKLKLYSNKEKIKSILDGDIFQKIEDYI